MRLTHLLVFLILLSPSSGLAALDLSEGKRNFLFEHDPKLLSNTVHFAFRSGSLHDPKGKEGLARLSFLALLRGTQSKSRIEFISQLETLGAAMGVDTQSTRTLFSLNVISENLAPALNLAAEALLSPGLRDSDIEQLIAEEKAKLNQERSNNRGLARRTYRSFLMKGTPWAHTADGDLKSIEKIKADDIRAFVKDHVKSGNLIVVAASNKSKGDIESLVEKALAKVPDGTAVPGPAVTVPKRPEGIELVLVPRKGSGTTEIMVGHPGFPATHPDRFTLDTGMFVFGSEFTSRLSEELRKKRGWTYGAYAMYAGVVETPRRHGGMFAMYAFPQAQFTHLAAPKMIEMLNNYVKKGVTKKELADAVNAQSNSYPFYFAEVDTKLNRRLYEIIDGAEFPSVKKMRSILRSITQEKIKHAVQKIHTPNSLLVVLVGDPAALEKTKAALKNVKSTVTVNDPMTELPR